jgi:hypothetical protein
METLSFKTTGKVKKALAGLSVLDDVSQSEFIHSILNDLVEKREAEARLLIDALGIKDL